MPKARRIAGVFFLGVALTNLTGCSCRRDEVTGTESSANTSQSDSKTQDEAQESPTRNPSKPPAPESGTSSPPTSSSTAIPQSGGQSNGGKSAASGSEGQGGAGLSGAAPSGTTGAAANGGGGASAGALGRSAGSATPGASAGTKQPNRTPQQATRDAKQLLDRAEKAAGAGDLGEAFKDAVSAWEMLTPHAEKSDECRILADQALDKLKAWGEQAPPITNPATRKPLQIRS